MHSQIDRHYIYTRFRKCIQLGACIFALILPSEKIYAWGIVGHRIVCEVAFEHLRADHQVEINRLSRAFTKPNGKRFKDFRASCAFADTARHNARDEIKSWRHYKKFDRWHYLNVPRTTSQISASTINCRDDCVLDAIAFHSEKFSDPSLQDADRGEALIFLAHWVADIHQPLHVGFADDHGGSDIELRPAKRFGSNLHRAWDSGLLKRARGKRSLSQYISDIAEISEIDKAAWIQEQYPLHWAAESYFIATSKQVGYCAWVTDATIASSPTKLCRRPREPVNIDETYIARNTPIIEQRLQQAAVRLAKHIEKLLKRSKP